MKNIFTSLLLLIISNSSFSQVVWTYPAFPTGNDAVTIYYDATKGNGALANYTGSIYIHTGVITNYSTGPADWKHVVTVWGSTNASCQMTSLGNHIYSFYISGINNYYGVSGAEVIEQLAMVFRNGDGSIVGRDFDGSDIYADVWDGTSLQTKFIQPGLSPDFVNLNSQVSTTFITSKTATITLYENGSYVTQFNNSDSVSYNFTASAYGVTWIKAVADDGTTQVADSFYYVVNPAVTISSLPSGTDVGINYINDSTVTLVLVAPNKQFVYAIGDFSNWQVNDSNFMKKTPDGKDWWVTLTHLTPQQEYRYQFLVDGNIYIADPYADKILDPGQDPSISSATYPDLIAYPTGKTGGIVSVFQTGQAPYSWQDAGFAKPAEASLVIYELLLRDFVATHDYKTLMDTINYLKTLGVNAIELMPVSEFEGNLSWGYNPDFYFAPDKYYGPKDDLKSFINLCHENGIAVIQDIVLNHSCGESPMCQLYWDAVNNIPAADNPWFNQYATHPYSVCNDFNHESDYTHKFVDDVLKYWVTQYHMDGFRFDLSKGFTQFNSGGDVNLWGQYDQSRINNLERIADQIWGVHPTTYLILEHFAANSEEDVLSSYGFLLWSNSNYNYAQCAMGWNTSNDISWAYYGSHGFTEPHAVGYMESHDEERVAYKVKTYGNGNSSYSVKPLDSAMNRLEQTACFFFPIPGPKMMWQFGELGYDVSLFSTADKTAPKPILWNYYQAGPRKWLFNVYSALINLKKDYSVFQTGQTYLTVGGLYKSMRLTDASLKATILGNFDIVTANVPPYFLNTGWWYEYFTGDSIYVNDINAALSMKPGEYRLYTDKKITAPDLGNVGMNEIQNPNTMTLQAFPIPAKDFFTVDFYLTGSGNATLELFDISGRKISTLADKKFSGGWYTVDVPCSDFENGTYICKLSSADDVKTLKIQIEK